MLFYHIRQIKYLVIIKCLLFFYYMLIFRVDNHAHNYADVGITRTTAIELGLSDNDNYVLIHAEREALTPMEGGLTPLSAYCLLIPD